MSQFQVFIGSEGPGPGPVLSLVGDDLTVVPPNGAGQIFVDGKTTIATGFAQTKGNAANFTLSILPLTDTVATVDASTTFFPNAEVFIDFSESVVMSANVIGNKSDGSAACGGFVTAVGRRGAVGGAVFVGENPLISRDSGTGTPTFGIILNGNDLNVVVNGVAAENWNWTCTYQWTTQVL